MKTIKIPTTDIEIPVPEFMNDGWWQVNAEWRLGKLTKLEFIRKEK
jgi:hypothetical protein